MYLSADKPSRSLRDVPDADGSLLLVGGNGHVTGRAASPSARLAELDGVDQDWFPGARLVARVVGAGLRASSRVPWAGPLLPPPGGGPGRGRVRQVGDDERGGGSARAAVRILGGHVDWAEELYAWGHPTPAAVAQAARLNAKVAGEMALGWAQPWGRPAARAG